VLDVVGSEATLALAVSVVRRLGAITLVGIAGGSYPFGYMTVPTEVSMASTFYGSIPELADVIALATRGKLNAEVETFPLEKAPDAYERLRQGTIRGRAVITPAQR